MDTSIYQLAVKLGQVFLSNQLSCAVAESCTGGSLAAAITDIPGSSQWFECGFVTYSNESKQQMLGVSPQILASEGAVSETVARIMAEGALAASAANVSAAITGIAGPGGGSMEKPVGTVWIAWAAGARPIRAKCYVFAGDRLAIRQQAVKIALKGLIYAADQESHFILK